MSFLSMPIIMGASAALPLDFPQVLEEPLIQGFSANTTSHNVSMPITVNVDELLMIFFSCHDNTTLATPSGWTEIYDTSPNFVTAGLFIKRADGTEGGTTVDIVTGTAQSGAAVVYRIGDWGGTVSTDVEAATATGSSTTPDPPSLSPSWGSAKTLWIEGVHAGDDDQTVTSASTNYGNLVGIVSGAGTDTGCETFTARRELEAASDDPDTMTLQTSETWVAVLAGIKPGTSGPSLPQCPSGLLTGLVSYWKFDENSGTSAADSAGSNTGTLTNMDGGTDWVVGLLNNALDFDGTDDFVNCGADASLDFAGDFTIALWINPRTWTNNDGVISKRDAANVNWQLFYSTGLRFWVNNGSTTNKPLDLGNADPSTGAWHHVAVTRSGDDWVLYLDGSTAESNTLASGIATGASVRIGVLGGDAVSNAFDGLIDDVRLYSRALDASEVSDLYNSGSGCVS